MPSLRTSGRGDSGAAVAPLRAFSPDTVYSANEVIAGVAGGSVGVLGTLIQLELKQVRNEPCDLHRHISYLDMNLFVIVSVGEYTGMQKRTRFKLKCQ